MIYIIPVLLLVGAVLIEYFHSEAQFWKRQTGWWLNECMRLKHQQEEEHGYEVRIYTPDRLQEHNNN